MVSPKSRFDRRIGGFFSAQHYASSCSTERQLNAKRRTWDALQPL